MHTRHCFIIAALIFATLAGLVVTTHAQTTININIASPTSGPGYTFADNVLTITQNGSYTITGTTTANRVVIGPNVVATVTLRDVFIKSDVVSPFMFDSTGCEVTLRIVGENTLSCADGWGAGLQVEGVSTSLTIDGSGSLTTTGGSGSVGIGGGSVFACGGAQGAGIGVGANERAGQRW